MRNFYLHPNFSVLILGQTRGDTPCKEDKIMKKTIRAIIAALLAALMAIGCTSAFAAEHDSQLLWDFYGWEYRYDYAGELRLGENTVTVPDNSNYLYYVFDAEESGFYTIGFTDYAFDGWIGTPEFAEDGTAFNEAENLYHKTESNFPRITFRFEKGENIIGIDFNNIIKDKTLEIVYEGNKIESVAIDGSLLLNRDIYNNGELCEIYADTIVTFTSGTSITLSYLEGLVTRDVKKGKNTVSFTLLGESRELTVDVYLPTDVIETVEISNIEDYLNTKVYYDGYEGYYPANETFTITFKDGTVQRFVFNEENDCCVTMPDGTKAYVYLDTEKEDDEIILNVMIADCVIRTYECSEAKASSDENLANLLGNAKYKFNRASRYFRLAFIAVLDCDSLGEYIEYGAQNSANYFRYSLTSFLEIFKEIFSFISFLL